MVSVGEVNVTFEMKSAADAMKELTRIATRTMEIFPDATERQKAGLQELFGDFIKSCVKVG